jgi:hypothetical protein
MGYMVSTLINLPTDDDKNVYIFVMTGGWQSDEQRLINENFTRLAERIGPRAVVVRGFREEVFTQEVVEKYLGKNYNDLPLNLPAFLIANHHPTEISGNTIRILIPLAEAKRRFGSDHAFFEALVKFARSGDQEILKGSEHYVPLVIELNRMLELKPNIAGVGININGIIERFFSRERAA